MSQFLIQPIFIQIRSLQLKSPTFSSHPLAPATALITLIKGYYLISFWSSGHYMKCTLRYELWLYWSVRKFNVDCCYVHLWTAVNRHTEIYMTASGPVEWHLKRQNCQELSTLLWKTNIQTHRFVSLDNKLLFSMKFFICSGIDIIIILSVLYTDFQ